MNKSVFGCMVAAGILLLNTGNVSARMVNHETTTSIKNATLQLDGGGQEKERKTKHTKALKKARRSAHDAKYAVGQSRSQVMGLAKVRNFFHGTFNTKPGQYKNFRKASTGNHWKKSKSTQGIFSPK